MKHEVFVGLQLQMLLDAEPPRPQASAGWHTPRGDKLLQEPSGPLAHWDRAGTVSLRLPQVQAGAVDLTQLSRQHLVSPTAGFYGDLDQLPEPTMLVLDEATSAVDVSTERRIQSALRRLCEGRTALVIAHRLATIRNADRIAVIQDGTVAELGSHEELIGRNGAHPGLYHAYEHPALLGSTTNG